MVFGGAEELGAVSRRVEVGGSEVASSSSSITLAFTVAVEEETQSLQEMEFVAAQSFGEVWSQT